MAGSIGEAMIKGVPIVFRIEGRVPEVVCEPGKEAEALELLHKLKLIQLMRPDDGRRPKGTLKPFAEEKAPVA